MNTPDSLNIKQWARERCAELIADAKQHISEGLSKEQALKIILNDSVLGAGYKAQITYEILHF